MLTDGRELNYEVHVSLPNIEVMIVNRNIHVITLF